MLQVQTQVVSLTLFTCDGEELVVDNLNQSDEIHIDIKHEMDKEEVSILYLSSFVHV